jgi:hypothetical protein
MDNVSHLFARFNRTALEFGSTKPYYLIFHIEAIGKGTDVFR